MQNLQWNCEHLHSHYTIIHQVHIILSVKSSINYCPTQTQSENGIWLWKEHLASPRKVLLQLSRKLRRKVLSFSILLWMRCQYDKCFSYVQAVYYGYVDLGMETKREGEDEKDKARNALVFMGVSLKSHWKIPLGYFLINSLSASARSRLLKKCLELIKETGAMCRSLTFDGAAVNIFRCLSSYKINQKCTWR